MLYKELEIKGNIYKLKLSTANTIALEKRIGCNPLDVFNTPSGIPSITTMVNILFFSMQKYHANIGLQDAYNLFDDYLGEHSLTDFINVILDIYKASGFLKEDKEENEKNV